MQTATLKSSAVAPNARVVRIMRSPVRNRSQRQRVMPSAAMYRPASKWAVVAACILAVALHAGAVVWFEMQQEKRAVAADVAVPVHTAEDFKTEAGAITAGTAGAKIAVD